MQRENDIQDQEEGSADWWPRYPVPRVHCLKKTRMHQQMYNMGLLRKDTLAIKYKPRDINHFLM